MDQAGLSMTDDRWMVVGMCMCTYGCVSDSISPVPGKVGLESQKHSRLVYCCCNPSIPVGAKGCPRAVGDASPCMSLSIGVQDDMTSGPGPEPRTGRTRPVPPLQCVAQVQSGLWDAARGAWWCGGARGKAVRGQDLRACDRVLVVS